MDHHHYYVYTTSSVLDTFVILAHVLLIQAVTVFGVAGAVLVMHGLTPVSMRISTDSAMLILAISQHALTPLATR